MALKKVTLADKYDLTQDRIFVTGYQALVRLVSHFALHRGQMSYLARLVEG